jgi:hypothetical protein
VLTFQNIVRSGVVAIGVAVALATAVPVFADETILREEVGVRHDRGVFRVTATFEVNQPVPLVGTVLTDYEAIPRFMPGVRRSVVVERTGLRALVEQEAVARMLMFSKRVHLLLEVDEDPSVIRFRDRAGRSFKRYEGSWSLAAAGPRTTVTYELTAQPSFEVPEFILRRLLARDAKRMIEGLRLEMARRNATSTGPGLP